MSNKKNTNDENTDELRQVEKLDNLCVSQFFFFCIAVVEVLKNDLTADLNGYSVSANIQACLSIHKFCCKIYD